MLQNPHEDTGDDFWDLNSKDRNIGIERYTAFTYLTAYTHTHTHTHTEDYD